MTRLKQFWIGIKTSFWFIPAIINIILILIAMGVIKIDYFLAASKQQLWFELPSLREGSVRVFLATIAGSMMTIAGVVFSITILVLAQTSIQYSPRVLKNFMSKKSNQVMLGIFVGIFIFCLFLITNIHPIDNSVSALSGFLLAIIGVGFLIYYIHQTSISIQATEILRSIQEETSIGIATLYPELLKEKEEPPQVEIKGTISFLSTKSGYLQALDFDALLKIAEEFDTQIEVLYKIGDFIATGEEICRLEKDHTSDESFMNRVNRSFVIGKYRTAVQDVAYGIQQIVDMALRGLGNNDLSTTHIAIDYLRSILIQLVDRDLGSPNHYCKDRPMIFAPLYSFQSLLEISFKSICANAKGQPTIQEKINETIKRVRNITKNPERQAILNGYTCEG